MNKLPHPPAWVNRLLDSFCAPHLLEEVQGDLQELYGKWVEKHGVKKARWLYTLHAIKFLRPQHFKRLTITTLLSCLKTISKLLFATCSGRRATLSLTSPGFPSANLERDIAWYRGKTGFNLYFLDNMYAVLYRENLSIHLQWYAGTEVDPLLGDSVIRLYV